jgi:HD superfamily phosphohydrolase YqeK
MRVPPTERERWLRAVYLHDALRDAPEQMLLTLADDRWHQPSLLHGPAAAEYAARDGEQDPGVLSAARFHSVGWAGWDRVGHILYLADYLEPGRAFREEERRVMAARVPAEIDRVLREVAAERLRWIVSSGWPLIPETVEFWNVLSRGS